MSKLLLRLFTGSALALVTFAGPATAAPTVGVNRGGNCYPFSCLPTDGGEWYQQIYSAAAFTGTTSISSISFFKASGGGIDSATYSLKFYQTAVAVSGLTGDRASNLGTLIGNFGSFALSGMMPDVLTFSGEAFDYDPSAGNLVLDVSITIDEIQGGYRSFFQADDDGVTTSRAWGYISNGEYADSNALVTEFNRVEAVPEPASWALLITGFGLTGTALRRRRLAIA